MLLELDEGFFKYFITDRMGRNIFYEDIKDRENLIVTIGDSWTWGDSIDGIAAYGPTKKLDSPKRLECVYGRKMQEMLGEYDWINIGYPGSGNRWITDVAMRFKDILPQCNYKKVIIVCVFSDTMRDISYGITDLGLPEDGHFPDMVEALDRAFFERLKELEQIENVTLIVARNFTNTHESNIGILKHHIPIAWIEFSRLNWNVDYPPLPFYIGYPDEYRVRHDKNPTLAQMQWGLEVGLPTADSVFAFLDECPLHYKMVSKHPTEENHELWAKYLIKYMKNQNII